MQKVHKALLEILIENFTNERLDEIAFRDKEFRSADRKLNESLKRYDELSLPAESDKVVGQVFDAYGGQSAVYADIAYRQGIIDCVQLLKEMGVISNNSIDKESGKGIKF